MQTKEKIWIYGASGHGKVILDCLEANNLFPFGFIDDDPKKNKLEKLTIYSISAINQKSDKVIFGIGNNETRKKLDLKGNYRYLTVVHPTATLSPFSNLDDGTVVFHHAVIQSGSKIGRHVIINTKASIDHDCLICDYAHISPGAILCGNVSIGEGSWIGAGSVIIQGITIGKNVMIGAGSVIICDVPDNVVVVGKPGKIIRNK